MTAALHAAIMADPDAAEPRRALAAYYDALGDPRGEFIRLQLDIATQKAVGIRDGALLGRERALLTAHRTQWTPPFAPLVTTYRYHRGMIGEVELPLDRFLDIAATLLSAAPIQHLDLTAPRTRLAELFTSPHLSRLTSLSLERMSLGDSEARLIADAPKPPQLRWLSLAGNRIARPGVEALAASRPLRELDVLDLSNNPCDPVPRPGAYELDGTVTAVDNLEIAEELSRAHGFPRWLRVPDNLDAWPLSRDSYR